MLNPVRIVSIEMLYNGEPLSDSISYIQKFSVAKSYPDWQKSALEEMKKHYDPVHM